MQKLEKKVSAVLVAAGSSTRMGFDKLSFDLGGETVVQRSIRAFAECPLVSEIVLVAGKNRAFLEQQAAACAKPVQVVHPVTTIRNQQLQLLLVFPDRTFCPAYDYPFLRTHGHPMLSVRHLASDGYELLLVFDMQNFTE